MPREFLVVRLTRHEAEAANQAFVNGIAYHNNWCEACIRVTGKEGCSEHAPAIALLRGLRKRFRFPDSVIPSETPSFHSNSDHAH